MSAELETHAYWVSRGGHGELRPARVPADPGPGRSLIRAAFSGVSPGTERLVGLGLVPARCQEAMACRHMEGDFTLPIKYGYTLVGTAINGALEGRRLFCMHPHQGLAVIEDAQATPLPDGLPVWRAALIPSLETALNAVWDAELAPAEQTLVVGGGCLGRLLAYVLKRRHDAPTVVVELDPARRASLAAHSWVDCPLAPAMVAEGRFAVAFNASGSGAGLQTALDAVGFEGRVIELSWYGCRTVQLNLGTHFHYQRKRIIASQVTVVAPSHRSKYGYRDRLAEVVTMLADPALDGLRAKPVPFAEMPALMRKLYAGTTLPPLPLITYLT